MIRFIFYVGFFAVLAGCVSSDNRVATAGTGIYVSDSEEGSQAFDWDGTVVFASKVVDICVERAEAMQVGYAGIWGVRVEVDENTARIFEKIVIGNQVDVFYMLNGKVGLGFRVDSDSRMALIPELEAGRGDCRVFLWMGKDVTDKSMALHVAKMLDQRD